MVVAMKIALLALLSLSPAHAGDEKLITPYPGSGVVTQKSSEFDGFLIPLGPTDAKGFTKTQELQGRKTYVELTNPKERSYFEIYKNYESALKKAGFQLLYSCKGSDSKAVGLPACGPQKHEPAGFGYWPYGTSHYVAAKKKHEGKDIWVALDVQGPWTKIYILRPQGMETDKVEVNAEALKNTIEEEGHVAVYGIEFDTGKADIKPASDPIVAEIAKLLKAAPGLKLYVVGHTDAVGAFDANRGLSERRASAIARALVEKHGIEAARLEAHGVGPLVPLATNGTPEGRARNRRVDLVKR